MFFKRKSGQHFIGSIKKKDGKMRDGRERIIRQDERKQMNWEGNCDVKIHLLLNCRINEKKKKQ